MKRPDLAWALSAVLPHAEKKSGVVGLTERRGVLYVWAMNPYTLGIARIAGDVPLGWDLRLTTAEATDLMRFVRPTLVAHKDEDIAVAVRDAELHIGITDDTAVFDLAESDVKLDQLLDLATVLYLKPVEWRQLILNPELVDKFAKAKRDEGDRLRIYPRSGKLYGSAVVMVGSDFLGAIAGMTYDEQDSATVAEFLSLEGEAA